MPQVEIVIGGRSFEVACQDGEEPFLRSAARMLDIEATALSNQIGRVPEGRMLLMAGLMLADKTAGLEERLYEAEQQISALSAHLAQVETARRTASEAVTIEVEVPVLPDEVNALLSELAERAEALAAKVEQASQA
ncbi:MAG: cell division protein ZapA [Rubellimicrobium sp.]|nr:cell division protein ZapA [Rubellimicrobium sp.]